MKKTSEAALRAYKKYSHKLREKGIKQHSFRCTQQQFEILRVFFNIVRKIENLDTLTGVDVSDDYKSFNLIFDDNIDFKAENLTAE